MILLTGFGPFREVTDNPSARLVRALHGLSIAGHRVTSLVLPVRWDEASRLAVATAAACHPVLVVGFGVAVNREDVYVEALARAEREGMDADGALPSGDLEGPTARSATVDVTRLAACLEARISDDAGRYLCNAWLYQVPPAVAAPAAFVHLPPAGLHPERVRNGLHRFLLP